MRKEFAARATQAAQLACEQASILFDPVLESGSQDVLLTTLESSATDPSVVLAPLCRAGRMPASYESLRLEQIGVKALL